MPDETLKPCPFCGGAQEPAKSDWIVQCRGCGARGPLAFSFEQAAAWNQRPGERAAAERMREAAGSDLGLAELAHVLVYIADDLEAENYLADCDAGNWDGGSAEGCAHCRQRSYPRRLRQAADALLAALPLPDGGEPGTEDER